jgi:hypothetical protein
MQVDSGKASVSGAVQVGDVEIKIQDAYKGPMIFEKSVNTSQKLVLLNVHEANSSNSKDTDKDKYTQPRWCPPGLTHTRKRMMQHLRHQEQKEKEADNLRDEHFPQGKVLHVKKVDQPTGPVRPPPAVRSDRYPGPV